MYWRYVKWTPQLASAMAILMITILQARIATAQGQTGTIVGTVSDSSKARLPGVTVTIASPALIRGQISTVTTATGEYRFPSLPPGDYALTFELAGFQSVKREGVRVQASETFAVDVALDVAGVSTEVTVIGGTPLIDVKGAEVSHTVSEDVIQSVPVARRFSDLLNTLPGVTDGLYTFSPANTVYGGSVRDNVYTMDGLNFVDPVVRTAVTDVPFDDVQEVQVTTAGFNAEFGQAAGGIFNFVTKSGGNSFKGIGNFYLQNKSLESSNISASLRQQGITAATSVDHIYDWGGNLGGPIRTNRVWFFQSYHKLDQEQSQSDFPSPITVKQWQTLSKITTQVTPRNRVEGSYSRRNRNFTPFNFGFAVAADPRTWIGIGWINDAANFTWNASPTHDSVFEVRGGFTLFDLQNLEPHVVPGTPVYLDQGSGIITGGPDGTFGLNQRDHYEARADYTMFRDNWLHGSHNLKAGFHWELLKSNTIRRTQAQSDDTHHLLLNTQPFRVRLWNLPLRQTAGLRRLTGYVQDQWTLSDRVTINAGVRIENSYGYLPESELLGGRWSQAQKFAAQDDLFNPVVAAPRFGIVWDVTGKRRTTARFSIGQFYQAISNLEVGVASPATVGRREYDWIDRNGDRVYQPGEEGVLRSDTTGTKPGAIDPNLKIPHTNMVAGAFEHELMKNVVVAVSGTYKNEHNMIEQVNITVPFSAYVPVQVTNPLDGQPLTIFSLRPQFLGLASTNLLTNPTSPFSPIRRYKGVEFSARKQMSDRWSMLASYNVGRAEGHVGTLFFDTGETSLFLNPNQTVNAFGPTSLDRTHMFKAEGTVQLPYGVNLSGFYSLLSGVPWLTSQSGGTGINGARVVRFLQSANPGILTETFIDVAAEPRGSQRFDAEQKLDLRVERNTKVSRATLGLQFDLFNVFNANTIIRVQSLRTDASNYLRPAQIMLPRVARLGVRVTF